MKRSSFLFRNFFLWFFSWLFLFVLAIHNESEVFKTLLIGVLLTCIAAMAAFDNMDMNEKKKKAREDIDNYMELIEIISTRYFSIKKICEMCNRETNIDHRYTRGLRIPELHVPTMYSDIKFSKYGFIVKGMSKFSFDDDEDIKYALDLMNYINIESSYRNLISSIALRNQQHRDIIDRLNDKGEYQGADFFMYSAREYSSVMSFYEFSSYLKQTERIIIDMNYLIEDYKRITMGLKFCIDKLFDNEVAKEYGGIFEVPLYEDLIEFKYVNLSEQELLKLDYPDFPHNVA